MAAHRNCCTHNSREIICQRHGGSHDTSAWIQTLSENDTVPGSTFGRAVQITRWPTHVIWLKVCWSLKPNLCRPVVQMIENVPSFQSSRAQQSSSYSCCSFGTKGSVVPCMVKSRGAGLEPDLPSWSTPSAGGALKPTGFHGAC